MQMATATRTVAEEEVAVGEAETTARRFLNVEAGVRVHLETSVLAGSVSPRGCSNRNGHEGPASRIPSLL